MSDDESRLKVFISYAIFAAVAFATFIAPALFFVLTKFFDWEPPQFLQDWLSYITGG